MFKGKICQRIFYSGKGKIEGLLNIVNHCRHLNCRCREILLKPNNCLTEMRFISNKSAVVTKIHRKLYMKLYPVRLVQPDGSTYTIRHFEPRKIIKLPQDFSLLSDEEKQIVLEKRKPKKKVVIEDEIEDNFDAKKYTIYLKKKVAQ